MKKLLMIFSISLLAVAAAFSQDDTPYTGDEGSVAEQAHEAPPPLPDYVQPPCPYEGYLWTPGYWAWGPEGYYWVAGVWVMPPSVGLLWTPGYWSFYGGYYGWHRGYWGNTIGYYGGINYGYGYFGTGFYGGRWEGSHFLYNRSVCRLSRSIRNTYESREGVRMEAANHASYNGRGGVIYRPEAREEAAMHANHMQRTNEQERHQQMMGGERGQFAHTNQGRPATTGMSAPNGQRYNEGRHEMRSNGGGQRPAGRSGGGERSGGHGGGGGHSGGHGGGGRH